MASVLTIGVFDGVHRGHQALVAETVARAATAQHRAIVVTFDPNPLEVLRPGHAPTRLCSVAHRVELLHALGIDGVDVLRFDDAMSHMPATEFVETVLVRRHDARQVVIGAGFRFGHKAAGTAQTLRDAGLEVVEFDLAAEGAEAISSTRVRARIAEGDVELAASMLGRRHSLTGPVTHGQKRGRTLGYPTANLCVDSMAAIPADGVYAGYGYWPSGRALAAISVGTNPTFGVSQRTVEAYLLDVDQDLYGSEMTVEFAHRLRPMEKFEGVQALIEAMRVDVAKTRDLLGPGRPKPSL